MNKNNITLDEIFSEVKGVLRSYDAAGLIDESFLFPHVLWLLNRAGYTNTVKTPLVLDVINYEAAVPYNFKSLITLYKCDRCNDTATSIKERWFFGLPHKFEVHDISKRFCYNKCEIEEEKTEIKRTIFVENERKIDYFCNKNLLEYSGAVNPAIAETCPNLKIKSTNKFNYDKDKFFFNFESGSVFIYYNALPLDDYGYPIIEDDPYLLKALVDLLIFQSFKMIYYNGDYDVQQRLSFAEQEHQKSLGDLIVNSKLPTYKDTKTYFKNRNNAYNVFNLKGIADAYRNTTNLR